MHFPLGCSMMFCSSSPLQIVKFSSILIRFRKHLDCNLGHFMELERVYQPWMRKHSYLVCGLLRYDTVYQPRRSQFKVSPPWEPQISKYTDWILLCNCIFLQEWTLHHTSRSMDFMKQWMTAYDSRILIAVRPSDVWYSSAGLPFLLWIRYPGMLSLRI
jgi:hypothetical protein